MVDEDVFVEDIQIGAEVELNPDDVVDAIPPAKKKGKPRKLLKSTSWSFGHCTLLVFSSR